MSWQRFKEQLREYFTFTKKERNGVIVLLIILALMQGGILFTHLLENGSDPPKAEELSIIYKAGVALNKQNEGTARGNDLQPAITYFTFNPNTISAVQWKLLGINDRTIHSIENYLAKGGKFYKKTDLKKIYNLQEEDYNRIESFIEFPEEKYAEKKEFTNNEYKAKKQESIEINTAGIDELMKLPYIGEKRAEQIIKYRSRLGGFYCKEQLLEVYSIPDSIYNIIEPYVLLNKDAINQININTDTIRHPYLKYQFSKIILNYRNQHGSFKSVDDIRGVQLITDSIYSRIAPYLKVE